MLSITNCSKPMSMVLRWEGLQIIMIVCAQVQDSWLTTVLLTKEPIWRVQLARQRYSSLSTQPPTQVQAHSWEGIRDIFCMHLAGIALSQRLSQLLSRHTIQAIVFFFFFLTLCINYQKARYTFWWHSCIQETGFSQHNYRPYVFSTPLPDLFLAGQSL